MDKAHWFIAIVRSNTERKIGEKLSAMGYPVFVATQTEIKLDRKGKKKQVERIVLRSMVFVKSTEIERLELVKLPFIYKFLTDRVLPPPLPDMKE